MGLYHLNNFLKNGENYYSLIIAISKVARRIVDDANDLDGSCPDNPIEQAVYGLNSGEYEIVYSD